MLKMEEQILEINGVKIFIRIKGRGTPLLILHGWGSSLKSWEKVQDILSKQFKVIIFDLPGFGKSDLPPEVWNIDSYNDFLKKLVSHLQLKKFFLLGHSFGGALALKFTVKNYDKVEKLILVDAAIIRKPKNFVKSVVSFIAALLSTFSFVPGYKFLRFYFYRIVIRKTDYPEAVGVMKETFKNVISEDLASLCSEIKTPTLIIWGEKDKITPLEDGCKIHNLIKGSQLEIIKGAAHAPYLSHPQILSTIVANYLNQNG